MELHAEVGFMAFDAKFFGRVKEEKGASIFKTRVKNGQWKCLRLVEVKDLLRRVGEMVKKRQSRCVQGPLSDWRMARSLSESIKSERKESKIENEKSKCKKMDKSYQDLYNMEERDGRTRGNIL